MNTAKLNMALPWGERTQLLPKAMVYAFSLDLRARSHGPYLTIESSPDVGVRHLFDESIVSMPEGLRCDVPRGRIDGGDGEIGAADDPSSCWLDMRVTSELRGANAKLHFAIRGVVSFDGGQSAFRNPHAQRLTGSSNLASCQEASTGSYRWLERRQLFGVGRVDGTRPTTSAGDEWRLHFSFDLYAAL